MLTSESIEQVETIMLNIIRNMPYDLIKFYHVEARQNIIREHT